MTVGLIKQAVKSQTHFKINYDQSVTKYCTFTNGVNSLHSRSELKSYKTSRMRCTWFDNKYVSVRPSTCKKKIRKISILIMNISRIWLVIQIVWFDMTSNFSCKSQKLTWVTQIKKIVISRIRPTGTITHRKV